MDNLFESDISRPYIKCTINILEAYNILYEHMEQRNIRHYRHPPFGIHVSIHDECYAYFDNFEKIMKKTKFERFINDEQLEDINNMNFNECKIYTRLTDKNKYDNVLNKYYIRWFYPIFSKSNFITPFYIPSPTKYIIDNYLNNFTFSLFEGLFVGYNEKEAIDMIKRGYSIFNNNCEDVRIVSLEQIDIIRDPKQVEILKYPYNRLASKGMWITTPEADPFFEIIL